MRKKSRLPEVSMRFVVMFIFTPSHLIGDSPGRHADEAAEA
jgi:hypothetical protein